MVQMAKRFSVSRWRKKANTTLSVAESGFNVLYVRPRSEDPPLGLIDRQSRLSLGSTDMGGNVERKVSVAEGIPDALHVCSWRLDVSRWI